MRFFSSSTRIMLDEQQQLPIVQNGATNYAGRRHLEKQLASPHPPLTKRTGERNPLQEILNNAKSLRIYKFLTRTLRYAGKGVDKEFKEYVRECPSFKPNSPIRHANMSTVGSQRGRYDEMERVKTIIENIGPAPEQRPLITVVDVRRQGKSLFLDSIGHSAKIYKALRDKSGRANVIVFDLRLEDENGHYDEGTYDHRLIEQRLLSGMSRHSRSFRTDSRTSDVEFHFCPDLKSCIRYMQSVASEIVGVDLDQLAFIYLLHDLSKVGVRDATAKTFTDIGDLICVHRVFIVGAFYHMSHFAALGRSPEQIVFKPVTEPVRRRDLNVMKTRFVNLFAFETQSMFETESSESKSPSPSYECYRLYEILKSSPGMLGSALAEIGRFSRESNARDAVWTIPILSFVSIGHEYKAARGDVLAWKSIQFISPELSPPVHDSKSVEMIKKNLHASQKNEVGSVSLGDNSDLMKMICDTRLDPAFAFIVPSPGPLHRFDRALTLLANAIDKINSQPPDSLKASWNFSDNSSMLKHFELIPNANRSAIENTSGQEHSPASNASATREQLIDELVTFFIQDSIAFGVLVQRHFRSRALVLSSTSVAEDKLKFNGFLKDFLANADFVHVAAPNRSVSSLAIDFMSQLTTTEASSHRGDASRTLLEHFEEFAAKEIIQPDRYRNYFQIETEFVRQRLDSSLDSIVEIIAGQEDEIDHKTLFNTRNILIRKRQFESNPTQHVADVIFHEKVCDKNELIQFWISTIPSSSSVDRFPHKATDIASCLESKALYEASRRENLAVRHVVHIVVSTTPRDVLFQNLDQSQLPKADSINDGIQSYSLVLVNLDDINNSKAFENLVSQPIAVVLPHTRQQLAASGSSDNFPSPDQFWSYRATDTDPKKIADFTQEQFSEWRHALHDQELACGMGHKLFNSLSEAQQAACGRLTKQRELRNMCGVPFAAILEEIGLLPARWNGDSYTDITVELSRTSSHLLIRAHAYWTGSQKSRRCSMKDEEYILRLPIADEATAKNDNRFSVREPFFENVITIGNLLHHQSILDDDISDATKPVRRLEGDEYVEDDKTAQFWNRLFSVASNSDERIACGQLFTMSISDWKLNKKNFEANIKSLIERLKKNESVDVVGMIDTAVEKFEYIMKAKIGDEEEAKK